MGSFQILILLMGAAILLVGIAQKVRIPYPLLLIIGGGALGFLPILKTIPFDPNSILVIVLPPLLYYGAFWTSFQEFKRNWPEIFSLALGLVVATTLAIALIFKWILPQAPWALAFAFGAIVSPPDATAATALLKRFNISSRLLAVLEGESLINDAAALVLYKIAVTTLLFDAFSWSDVSLEFSRMVLGGVAVGALFGWAIQLFSNRFLPPVVGVMFSFTIPYTTYIIAESLHVSGILAVVVNGLILSHIYVKHLPALRRVLAVTPWDIFIMLLNCFVFILIGLQLRRIAESMPSNQMITYALYSVFITAALIVVRMIWVYTEYGILYLRAKYNPHLCHFCPQIFREGAILGWSGMRGIISLTAALALPLVYRDNSNILERDAAIYMAFIVILLTLLIPGFTLSPLLKWLNIHPLSQTYAVAHHRKRLLEVAEQEIQAFAELTDEERALLLNYFNSRHRILEVASSMEDQLKTLEIARQQTLQAQRQLLLQMWENKEIDDKLLKQLELELDLEESFSIRAEIK